VIALAASDDIRSTLDAFRLRVTQLDPAPLEPAS
jgi:hypothetical protein